MATFPIVTVNASLVQAPTPNNLQQRGALVSQGATTKSEGSLTSYSTLAALLADLAPGEAILTLTWAGEVVTLTTVNPHGYTDGDVIPITVAGAAPTAYNGTFVGTVTGASTITYPLPSNPGSETVPGTLSLGSVLELTQMATTYFAGQGVPAISVLELGESTVTEGVTALTAFLLSVLGTDEQQYAYLLPREWDDNSTFLALANDYNSVSSMQYFYVTTTVANRAVYSGANLKCVFALVEAPSLPATEFSCASPFGSALKASPSSGNQVPPLSYAPSYGTTPYPIRGNQTIFQELANASVGWIGTGAQGGITGNILFQGKMSDGNAWNVWYSTDWAQINSNLNIANEVINGSAGGLNPLYYNQAGINRLQNRAIQTCAQGVAAGLGNGQVIATMLSKQAFLNNVNTGVYDGQIVVNAEPFATYVKENPSDYGAGKYAGLSEVWIPQVGFLNIFFDLQSTTLLTG